MGYKYSVWNNVIPAEAGIQEWRGEGSAVLPPTPPLDSGFRRNDGSGLARRHAVPR